MLDRDLFIRRLRYLSHRRSTLELDLLLQKIAGNLPWPDLTDDELSAVGAIIELDDVELQKALLARGAPPGGADPAAWGRVLTALEG